MASSSSSSSWMKMRFLGRGSYGSVFLAQHASSVHRKPSKKVPYVALKSALVPCSGSLEVERDVFRKLGDCEHIVKCLGSDVSVENGSEFYNLVLEYAPGGTLEQLIRYKGGRLSELEVACYTGMLLKGLNHVHNKGFVHCDMKPSNVLVFPPKNRYDGMFTLKISDFGAAKRRGERCPEFMIDEYGNMHRGTLYYSSPESVVFGEHEAATDVWSLGCIVAQMFGGKIGFWRGKTHPQILGNLIAKFDQRNLMLGHLSTNAEDFIKRCLRRDVHKRWTVEQLLSHPFIVESMEAVKEFEAHNRRTSMRYQMNQQRVCPFVVSNVPLVFVS